MSAPVIIPMSDSTDGSPTALPDAFLESDAARRALAFELPRYDDLPSVSLYRDQVIAYIDGVLEPLAPCAENAWITPSMVNNYVKQHLVPAPVRKQYGRPQVARLIIICVFKQFLPISAIGRLLELQARSYPDHVAFDYVATELEHALRARFTGDSVPADTAERVTRESLLVRSACSAFASKAYLMAYLGFAGF